MKYHFKSNVLGENRPYPLHVLKQHVYIKKNVYFKKMYILHLLFKFTCLYNVKLIKYKALNAKQILKSEYLVIEM